MRNAMSALAVPAGATLGAAVPEAPPCATCPTGTGVTTVGAGSATGACRLRHPKKPPTPMSTARRTPTAIATTY